MNDVAIDSTGKICLCLGPKTMYVVDLFRGKVPFKRELDYEPETINWVHGDDYFAISSKNVIHVYNKKFEEYKILECDKNQMLRVVSSFDNVLIAGTEKGEVITWNFTTEEEMKEEIEKEEEEKKQLEEIMKKTKNAKLEMKQPKEKKEKETKEMKEKKEEDDEFSISEEDEAEGVDLNVEYEKEENEKENDDISDEEEDDDELEEEEIEFEYPYKQVMKVKDGRIRGVEQMIVGEWVGYSVGFSDGSFVIIDTEGNVQLEMETGMRITAMGTTSW